MSTGKRRIELQLPEDLIEEIKVIAFRQHADDSKVVEAILRDYLANHPKPEATSNDSQPTLPGED